MFERVTQGFAQAAQALGGSATLTEANLDEATRHIRIALLEGDVEVGVVRRFVGRVKERALGEVVTLKKGDKRRSVGDAFKQICYRELVTLLGRGEQTPIAFFKPVTTVMLVGLQGVGKTTTAAKLAATLKAQGRKPLLVAADTQRPAAQAQLKTLGESIDVPVWFEAGLSPTALCEAAQTQARARRCDVVLLDTAGRLAIDEPLMRELADIQKAVRPHEVLLVCDAMAGQDTVRTAQVFVAELGVTGFVLTKLDGDARGGAALSLRELCGKPIKYLGVGEDTRALERFRPEGLASRILGMGDLEGLIDDFEQVVDKKQAERDSKKLLRGQFGLDDFLGQLRLIKKMGPLKDIVGKMPGLSGASVDEKQLVGIEALIQSMTPRERSTPTIIDASRRRRIARGAGRKELELTQLLERFGQMQQMMGSLGKQPGLLGGLGKMGKSGLKGLFGGGGMGAGAGAPSPAALPGLGGGLPKMPGLGAPLGGGLPGAAPDAGAGAGAGLTPEQAQMLERMQGALGQGARALPSQRDKERAKLKRKAEKKARKKARR